MKRADTIIFGVLLFFFKREANAYEYIFKYCNCAVYDSELPPKGLVIITGFRKNKEKEIAGKINYESNRYPKNCFSINWFNYILLHYFKEEIDNKNQKNEVFKN